jgi:hypothetical protein
MAATLEVVKDEQPGAITADLIAQALERRKAASATPLSHYDEEIGGVFTFRTLTGAEVRQCRAKALRGQRVDQDALEFAVVNLASLEPKITTALWAQLGQLGVMVQAGLTGAIFAACGLIEEPVVAAKNASSESPI